jgi:hypothetical protein
MSQHYNLKYVSIGSNQFIFVTAAHHDVPLPLTHFKFVHRRSQFPSTKSHIQSYMQENVISPCAEYINVHPSLIFFWSFSVENPGLGQGPLQAPPLVENP